MDPDEALKMAREWVLQFRSAEAREDSRVASEAGEELVSVFESLDGWLSKGGFLPKVWADARSDFENDP